ncbi:hypothetical protein [Butyrivibrio sp. XPD2006]|jgi:hypothetical protein|uniref:hypothetical protein n=1 Tax=Butyrivibrio sp. XPD2006 TaxID=1280668 RepID=UPI0003B6BCD0|nr:hypothetical protein [Butyrivibrio sp. XPD2006]
MNKLLLIYAAVIFIAGVVFFTIGQLNITKEGQDEETVEFFKWMRTFAIIAVILAAVCLVAALNVG